MGSRAMVAIADGQPDERRSPRFSVLLVARLVTTWGERIVKLRNISATGAMIEGDRIRRPVPTYCSSAAPWSCSRRSCGPATSRPGWNSRRR